MLLTHCSAPAGAAVLSDCITPFSVLLDHLHSELLEEPASVVGQVVVFPTWYVERNEQLAAIGARDSSSLELSMLLGGCVGRLPATKPRLEPDHDR